jgi:molybdate transport system permease protein
VGVLAVALAGCARENSRLEAAPSLTVFAAASLTEALTEAASRFEAEHACNVRLSFASSSTLARQVEGGASPGVYLSANPSWMDYLEERTLIAPGSRADLLGNRLVCIVPAGDPLEASTPEAWLTELDGRLAMGDPEHVPAGMYGAQALRTLGLWDQAAERLAPCPDTRAALRLVELGECRGGIVYETDAASSERVRIVARFDPNLHDPIRYPVAQLPDAGAWSERFLAFLRSPEAGAVFERHGFAVPTGETVLAGKQDGDGFLGLSRVEREAALVSVRVAGVSVALLLVPGILTGWLLARREFRGKSLVEAATHLPLVVPPVVTGYLLLLLLGRNGWAGAALERVFGVRVGFTMAAAVIASAVMALPLMVRAVRLAVDLVPTDLEEAAAVSGAGPVSRFFTVTLPLAGPGILAGLVLAFSRSLGEFGATMTFAGNIPGETQTIPLAIYTTLQRPGAESGVLKLALLSVVLSLAALWASRLLESRMRRATAAS